MMGSVCAEQQHKFHHSHQLYLKKALREIDIPPRKLLGRRSPPDVLTMDSPKADDAAFSKFLPYNNVDDDADDPYSSDHFRMFEFKVRKCNRSRSHDWTDCPFAHPGEKARRRDPRRFHYTGTVCSEYRKGHCDKGDNCEFSHGVFECWLHPSRYRTEACKDGKSCKRKVCFFAHSTRQLRMVPESSPSPPMNSPKAAPEKRYPLCCVFCHSMNNSPTSTLVEMSHGSPPASPPFSPGFSAFDIRRMESYGGDRFCGLGYKEALKELMASFEEVNMAAEALPATAGGSRNLPWVDVNDFGVDQEEARFMLSPSVPASGRGGPRKLYHGDSSRRSLMEANRYSSESSSSGPGPDLGWVNDLLT